MTSPELPASLIQSIEAETQRYRLSELRDAAARLSERYRSASAGNGAFVRDELEAAAYAAVRMPATYAAAWSVMNRISQRTPEWQPESFLDAGTGTGAGFWASTLIWPSITSWTLLDQDALILELAGRLASPLEREIRGNVERRQATLRPDSQFPACDVVHASYALNELPDHHIDDCVANLWDAARDAMVVVEPGTPAGFERLRRVRSQLIALGARIMLPCPHDDACPMPADDWCHFAVRLPRSRIHQSIKPGELAYEDEKFSYVVASRLPIDRAEARIIRHPQIRKGMVRLELCAQDGLRSRTVTKRKDRGLYRRARSASWGDEFPAE